MESLNTAVRYLQRWQNPDAQQLAEELAQAVPQGQAPEETRLNVSRAKGQMPISPALEENRAMLELMVGGSPDVVFRPCELGGDRLPAFLLFLDNMVEKEYVVDATEALMIRLRHEPMPEPDAGLADFLEKRALPNHQVVRHGTLGEVVHAVLAGDTVLLVDGLTTAMALATRGWEHRRPEEPAAEPVVRGPKEGFTETLMVNIALVRRRLQDERLRVEITYLGARSRTAVAVAYMAGLAMPELVAEVRSRLCRIQIDGVLESGYLEEMIEDHPFSPFPLIKMTERPDVVAGSILEGRVALLTDGTPHAMVVPATLAAQMQAAEDYYERWPMAIFVRTLRFLYFGIALLGPSTYIAITTFHHEMLPTNLLINLMAAREGVPFPALVEALMMELTLEVLREAGVRLPKPVGQAISIVGALVIGESAVRAGLVSPVMVIVVSVTAISSFVIPIYPLSFSVRLLRFTIMLLAGTLGFYGIIIGLIALGIHLASLRSFGVPYLSPVMPPDASDMHDLVIRAPWWMMRRRPRSVKTPDPIRQPARVNRPQPTDSGGG